MNLKISPVVRLSFGMAMLTLSMLLLADLVGLVPKRELIALDARKKTCESLAVQLSVAASRRYLDVMKDTLESFVDRNDDVMAASMVMENGEVLANYGQFSARKATDAGELSRENYVIVPIYQGKSKWGSVNVEFVSATGQGLLAYLKNSLYGILFFVLFGCYAGFYLILRRALRILDPESVVPNRVKSAFNTMSEGVLIIDHKEQILMVNDAFTAIAGKYAKSLIGMNISSLNWVMRDTGDRIYPWKQTLHEGLKQLDVSMGLSTLESGLRALSVNCAPIVEDAGNTRGVLMTVDDVTDVQETNMALEKAVGDLVVHQREITRKNNELETLATRDPLTGCYNRRAFFDKFEALYAQARANDEQLCCVMMDIDYFKLVNDTFGHAVGDEVICMVADVLISCQRADALVGRYGGEEFSIVLPSTNINNAMQIAERLRVSVHEASKKTHHANLEVTASFGVVALDGSVSGCSEMLDRADQALYVSKQNGRNRVSKWGQRIQRGTAKSSSADALPTDINEGTLELALLQKKIKQLKNKLKQSESENLQALLTDPVSGLPCRAILEDRLSQAIALSERTGTIAAVVILDIDMFSRINTAMGEVVGDAFLREIGNRLKSIIRRSDTVASMIMAGRGVPSVSRLHGDEFALVFSVIEDVESITYIVRRIHDSLRGQVDAGGKSFYVKTTVGVAMYPADGGNVNELIDHARSARKHARISSGNNSIQFYSAEMNQHVIEQMRLEFDMLKALENREFNVLYQPKLDMRTGGIVSAEALIRWQHAEMGVIPPVKFIPIAEKNGLIVDIGKQVLHDVCEKIKLWSRMGIEDLRVSINASVVELESEGFVENVQEALRKARVSARHLEIEITETALLHNITNVSETIRHLRALGVTMTLDDFGTGYSSFTYLGKLDIDWVKLDRSFLLDALENERTSHLYSSVVAMAQNVGLKVVSEGVETKEQMDFVSSVNIDEVQGYILSKPIEADAITAMIADSRSITTQKISSSY